MLGDVFQLRDVGVHRFVWQASPVMEPASLDDLGRLWLKVLGHFIDDRFK